MKPIISFDLDGTLVKPEFANYVWLDGLPRIYAKEKKVTIKKAKLLFKEAYDIIGSNRREWYDLSYWIKKYHLRIKPDDILDLYEDQINLFDDVKPVIQRLSKDFILVISSAAMQEFINKELKYTGIRKYFNYIFSSTSDSIMVKKDPSFYQMIAQSLHCLPTNIIHIGDNLNYDYYSAIEAGLHAYFLDRNSEIRKSFIVHSLEEFESILMENNFDF